MIFRFSVLAEHTIIPLLSSQSAGQRTALHDICLKGDINQVISLLESEADVDPKTDKAIHH